MPETPPAGGGRGRLKTQCSFGRYTVVVDPGLTATGTGASAADCPVLGSGDRVRSGDGTGCAYGCARGRCRGRGRTAATTKAAEPNPAAQRPSFRVELRGLEPLTPTLPERTQRTRLCRSET
jgi:hypothetical protein